MFAWPLSGQNPNCSRCTAGEPKTLICTCKVPCGSEACTPKDQDDNTGRDADRIFTARAKLTPVPRFRW